jgi:hypothetical protein
LSARLPRRIVFTYFMKPIRLSQHAQDQLLFRGASVGEIETTIRTTQWRQAGSGRLECSRDFVFDREWNGVLYSTKRVRPIFVDEPVEIVVVTVSCTICPGSTDENYI